MKIELKLALVFAYALAAGLSLSSTNAQAAVELGSADLLAGQNMLVGTVTIQDNGGSLEAVYTITDPDWCLQAVHAEAADSFSDLPLTRSGNPKVGHFEVNVDLDCESEYTADLGLTDDFDSSFVVAAHAVVDTTALCQSEGVVYGVERGTTNNGPSNGDIFAIDIVGGTQTLVKDVPDTSNDQNSPNGLAFDPVNGILYFSVTPLPGDGQVSELWKYDFGLDSIAGPLDIGIVGGDLAGYSAGATFLGTSYLYVENGTDDLKAVNLSIDPALETPLQSDFTANTEGLRFGDLVVIPGTQTIVGSHGTVRAPYLANREFTFFRLDTGSGAYTFLCTSDLDFLLDPKYDADCAGGLQLAFGSNGVLYAHSAGSGEYWSVDPATGLKDSAVPVFTASRKMTDLASGLQCVTDEETAWGDGDDFPGRSWATYIVVVNDD